MPAVTTIVFDFLDGSKNGISAPGFLGTFRDYYAAPKLIFCSFNRAGVAARHGARTSAKGTPKIRKWLLRKF